MREPGRVGRPARFLGGPDARARAEEAARSVRARPREEAPVTAPGKQGEKLKEELDDLLDEIDSVLEDNAEEFVRSYVQKGGQ